MENKQLIKNIYKNRPNDSRKYDYGLVIVIGGSRIYTGSPILTGLAALRSGADVAQIIAPQRAADAAAHFSPDLITFPINGDHFVPKNSSYLLEIVRSGEDVSRGNVSVVIGGGIGRDEGTKKMVRDFLQKVSVPVVVDADAIYAFEEGGGINHQPSLENKNVVFTPHQYEFYVLTGKNIRNLSREEASHEVRQAAKKLAATLLVKGKLDYISNGVDMTINEESVPYLGIGGTGDILAGIVGSLLARGVDPQRAASASALISTTVGKIASKKKREGIVAMDIIDKLPKAFNKKDYEK